VASGIGKPSEIFARQQVSDSPVSHEDGYVLFLFIGAALIILGQNYLLSILMVPICPFGINGM